MWALQTNSTVQQSRKPHIGYQCVIVRQDLDKTNAAKTPIEYAKWYAYALKHKIDWKKMD